MFASRTPRDLNSDPTPWSHDHEILCDVDRMSGRHPARTAKREAYEDYYDPDPAFDHPSHLPVNEILCDARDRGDYEDMLPRLIARGTYRDASPEKVTHAIRVLTRLVALRASV